MHDHAMPHDHGSREICLDLIAEPSSVPLARRAVRDALTAWGYGRDLVHDSMVVASELATNAIAAASGRTIRLRCAVRDGAPLLECWDPSPALPTARTASDDAESGRGLAIINAYAKEFGTRLANTGQGKVVWALMPR